MTRDISPKLMQILRTTLANIEHALDLAPGDPGLHDLKQTIVRTIAEIEVKRESVTPPAPGHSLNEADVL